MATIGQALIAPESGWKRFDGQNNLIKFNGNWLTATNASYFNGTNIYTADVNAKMLFNFTGNKIRILGYRDPARGIAKIKIDGIEETYTQNGNVQFQTLVYEKSNLENREHYVEISFGSSSIDLDALDIDSLGELKTFSIIYKRKVIVFNKNEYKYYSNNQWTNITSPIQTEQDYLTYGMDDISIIPESAWSQLEGEVELCYYTDDPDTTEVSFNIETKPFTLAEEWEDKEIKIIEFTDDPNQTESTITIETEPFTLYDELGDTVDVLYYTDDPTKTSAALNITANYSPLDELEGDFDVVTWTNDEEVIAGTRDMSLTYDALPLEQIIVQPTDLVLYGDLKKLVASKIVDSRTAGTLKLAASFDSGLTWKTYRFDKWVTLDIQNTTLFKRKGMSVETLNTIPEQDLTGLTRVAYYLDNSEHYENSYALDQVKMVVDAPRQTLEVQQMALQLLNTTATIDLTFSGNKLQGILNDADKGKVKYRMFLNGQPYYPASGEFTRLLPSPFKIEINIDERKFLFGKENTLKVEFQDYWGSVDSREFSFVGTYSGLMFMDESGDFLSDTFGGILKQLDYEVIIAGQTTLTKKVKLINQLGYAVDHVYLEMDKKFQTSGVEVQLSRQADPFLPIDYLTYGLMEPEESVDFYVRIATDIHAKPDPNGIFEMKVKADRV
ncbi:archaellin [Paenibacillus intestini]|nr:archaellin [Paenibacillus intestini]